MTPDDWARMSWHARQRQLQKVIAAIRQQPCQHCDQTRRQLHDLMARTRATAKTISKAEATTPQIAAELARVQANAIAALITPDPPEVTEQRRQVALEAFYN